MLASTSSPDRGGVSDRAVKRLPDRLTAAGPTCSGTDYDGRRGWTFALLTPGLTSGWPELLPTRGCQLISRSKISSETASSSASSLRSRLALSNQD